MDFVSLPAPHVPVERNVAPFAPVSNELPFTPCDSHIASISDLPEAPSIRFAGEPEVPFRLLPPDLRPDQGCDSIFCDVFESQSRTASPEHALLNDDTLLELLAGGPEHVPSLEAPQQDCPPPIGDSGDRLQWRLHKPRTDASRLPRRKFHPQAASVAASHQNDPSLNTTPDDLHRGLCRRPRTALPRKPHPHAEVLAPDRAVAQPLPAPALTLRRRAGSNAGIRALIMTEARKGTPPAAIAELSPCRRVGHTQRTIRDVIYPMQKDALLPKKSTVVGTPREITDADRSAALRHFRNGLRAKDILTLPQFAGRGVTLDQLYRAIDAARRTSDATYTASS